VLNMSKTEAWMAEMINSTFFIRPLSECRKA
jgi:hypothetical protein